MTRSGGGGWAVLGFGVATAIALLLLTESGLPVLIPADLLMLLVGERASAGDVSLATRSANPRAAR